MNKKYLGLALVSMLSLSACNKDWLEREPKSLVVEENVWNDSKLITSLLANYYDRLPTESGLQDVNDTYPDGSLRDGRLAQWRNMADYDDAMWSGQSNQDGRNNITSYATNRWFLWNYSLIRDLNKSLENIQQLGTNLDPAVRTQFMAEFRFLRAFAYFEMVKRMGGVPLITKQLLYDYSGHAGSLRQARAKESEVYEFIAKEMDDIKSQLGNETNGAASNSRANRYTAMALKSRAMLYAASIAKYTPLNAPLLTLPGGEVGIPAGKANEYYQQSLEASREVINSGMYSLKSGSDAGLAFYEAVSKKANNREVILVKDFLISKDKRHLFTYDNIARSVREDNLSSSSVTPSLNLVESFEYLDGSPGTLKTRTADNSDFIYYDKPESIFANKDARMAGTVLYPGSNFKGATMQMQAGVMVWNGTGYQTVEGTQLGAMWGGTAYPNGDGKLLTGAAGPHRSIQEVSNTGFYMRKYVDDGPLTSTRGIRSDTWWVWFRLGEIYLNATEAAYELGLTSEALVYINKLRERAGFPPNSINAAGLDMARIRNERRVELAFEDHRIWDLIRWRIADQVWNGNTTNPNAMVYALYPYRVVRPGDAARDGKYVFVKMVAPRFRAPRFFQVQNYYTFIPQNVMDNNPLLVRNPFQ